MTNLQYTPAELIAECEAVKTNCTNAIAANQEVINNNNMSIDRLLQGIIDFNNEIDRFKANNNQRVNDIATLHDRIAKEDAIITDYLQKLK